MTTTRNQKTYNKNAWFVSKLWLPVVELLNPQSGEHILDIWCGDGKLMQEIATSWATVVWIDPSESFIHTVKKLWFEAYVWDGRYIWFENQFDAVFSNAAIHWMQDINLVLQWVKRSLKPWGRFVGEFWWAGNVKTIIDAIYTVLLEEDILAEKVHTWYFADPDEFASLLDSYWFEVQTIDYFARPTPLPNWLEGRLEQFAFSFFGMFNEEKKQELLKKVYDRVHESLYDKETGQRVADYVRLRFTAKLI